MNIKKDLLIIASDIGKTAPGIVYKTILNQLEREYNINVISPIVDRVGLSPKINILPSYKIRVLRNIIEKLIIIIFGTNIFQEFWAKKQFKSLSSDFIAKADLVISFISFHHYGSLMLGSIIAGEYKKKHIVYSVDAIPAPIGWVNNTIYYDKTKKLLNKHLTKVDAFYASNEQMLNYQMEICPNFNQKIGVLYTPIREITVCQTQEGSLNKPLFLYTGGLYGPRKYDAVIEGFESFLKKTPNAILRFVGSGPISKFKKYSHLIEKGNLEICNYSSNLSEHYSSATALIDINAYFDNDVFLSSKIINYLPIKKPIISVTGDNSPSRNIFQADPSIIHAHHNPAEICSAMDAAFIIDNIGEERDFYIEKFRAENCLNDFKDKINNLI